MTFEKLSCVAQQMASSRNFAGNTMAVTVEQQLDTHALFSDDKMVSRFYQPCIRRALKPPFQGIWTDRKGFKLRLMSLLQVGSATNDCYLSLPAFRPVAKSL